jgi:hypothetical protein
MVTGRDDCGLVGSPRTAGRYLGQTTMRPNINSTQTSIACGRFNTSNTVGWGPLPGYLGYTCYWWGSNGKMIAADMKLDPAEPIVATLPVGCTYRFDLQSLATHEWGHAYGLNHPGPEHARLTMTARLTPCSYEARTLGLGDWRGMRRLYGLR